MKKFILSIITLLLVSGTVFAKKNRYVLEVGQFDKLSVFDNVSVVFKSVPDSTGYIAYEGVEDFADSFIFTNSGGNLKIQVTTEDVGKPDLPVIRVYSDFLTEVQNSSDSTVRVLASASVPNFTAKIIGNGKIHVHNLKANESTAAITTGNGTITMDGAVNKARFKMLGTGLIQADELRANDVKCSIMGAGQIGCWAVNRLDVRGIGSTKIYYRGNPKVKKVGGGKVFPINVSTEETNEELTE